MRLHSSRIAPAGDAIEFEYDGRKVSALDGETIAAALSAAAIIEYRNTRSGGRRGLYCGMGTCFDCLVSIDGRAGQRACLTKVERGMRVLPQDRPGGPAALAPLVPDPDAAAPQEVATDLLVVGAGPAGLPAARAARERGARVIVLDERLQSGGQYFKPLAPSHRAAHAPDRQFAQGEALERSARAAGVEIIQSATVWSAFAPNEIGAIVDGRARVYRPRQLILATGAYERPAPFPGWTLPGVMTTGAAQTLARAYRVAPGAKILIAGNGPLNLQVAAELVAGGAHVVAVLESARKPTLRQWRAVLSAATSASDLLWDGAGYLARLRLAGVPVLWGRRVIAAGGRGTLAEATYVSHDAGGRPLAGSETRVDCDALCLGYGFIPSTEIARQLGCRHVLIDRHIGYVATETDYTGATSIPGIFAVGDGANMGGSRVALARGALAGIAAAANLGFPDANPRESVDARALLARAERFQRALWSLYAAPPVSLAPLPDETIACRCEEIDFGALRAQILQGRDTLAALKRNTRLGMGRCQGRYCANTAAKLLEEITGSARELEQFFAPRAPTKPIPAAALCFEKPEWGGHRPAITPNVARPVETAPMADQRTDTLVIGGGVLGSCLAYYLAAEGQETLVVERDDLNLQASGANAGSLHVQLLSFDFGAKAQAGGIPAAQTLPLGPLSVDLWRAIERDCGDDLEMKITGGLMVADSAAAMRFLEEKVALERRYGIDAAMVGTADLRKLAPHLSEDLLGGEFCPMEGKINPLRATYAVMQRALVRGARFQRGTDVQSIRREAGDYVVATSRGVIRAARVVNAAGAWSSRVAQMAGIDIPVTGAPLQMLVTEPTLPVIDHLVAHADRHLSLKQAASGGVIIGGGWTAAFDPDKRINYAIRESIEGNLWVAAHVLPALRGMHVVRCWAGMNVNIDGAPILGPVPGMPGFFNAVTSNGYTLAPIVARLSADLIVRGRTDVDVTPFLIDRFR
jgi:glycine/D-amino acid oxidase-like deaminating enzyme